MLLVGVAFFTFFVMCHAVDVRHYFRFIDGFWCGHGFSYGYGRIIAVHVWFYFQMASSWGRDWSLLWRLCCDVIATLLVDIINELHHGLRVVSLLCGGDYLNVRHMHLVYCLFDFVLHGLDVPMLVFVELSDMCLLRRVARLPVSANDVFRVSVFIGFIIMVSVIMVSGFIVSPIVVFILVVAIFVAPTIVAPFFVEALIMISVFIAPWFLLPSVMEPLTLAPGAAMSFTIALVAVSPVIPAPILMLPVVVVSVFVSIVKATFVALPVLSFARDYHFF